jgi:peptide deformylase
MLDRCPCCSNLSYSNCCQPFHNKKPVENALQLMRARYSAYALHKIDFIIETTHPASPNYYENKIAWRKSLKAFCERTNFSKLVIHNFQESGLFAEVAFTAYFTQEEGADHFFEKSYFNKLQGKWLYLMGHPTAEKEAEMAFPSLDILPLAYYNDPILRRQGSKIESIDDDIRELVRKMIATMKAHNGLGLAAPQVHKSLKLFVAHKVLEGEDGHFESGDVEVYINPTLSSPSKELWLHQEGCLSIPTIRADVPRPRQVILSYTNLAGEQKTEELSGWAARVVMHENDHVNGTLFIDRLDKRVQSELKPRLKSLEQRLGFKS